MNLEEEKMNEDNEIKKDGNEERNVQENKTLNLIENKNENKTIEKKKENSNNEEYEF